MPIDPYEVHVTVNDRNYSGFYRIEADKVNLYSPTLGERSASLGNQNANTLAGQLLRELVMEALHN